MKLFSLACEVALTGLLSFSHRLVEWLSPACEVVLTISFFSLPISPHAGRHGVHSVPASVVCMKIEASMCHFSVSVCTDIAVIANVQVKGKASSPSADVCPMMVCAVYVVTSVMCQSISADCDGGVFSISLQSFY